MWGEYRKDVRKRRRRMEDSSSMILDIHSRPPGREDGYCHDERRHARTTRDSLGSRRCVRDAIRLVHRRNDDDDDGSLGERQNLNTLTHSITKCGDNTCTLDKQREVEGTNPVPLQPRNRNSREPMKNRTYTQALKRGDKIVETQSVSQSSAHDEPVHQQGDAHTDSKQYKQWNLRKVLLNFFCNIVTACPLSNDNPSRLAESPDGRLSARVAQKERSAIPARNGVQLLLTARRRAHRACPSRAPRLRREALSQQ
jgi:hypothetical protein